MDEQQPQVIPQLPPELLAQLGLPATFVPVPIAWHLAHLAAQAGGVAPSLLVVILDTATGRNAFVFTDEDARKLADAITSNTTGLTVARTLDTPNGSFRRPDGN